MSLSLTQFGTLGQLGYLIVSIPDLCTLTYFQILIEILQANSGNPDQMLSSAESDLGLHYLTTSNKKDARLIWVEMNVNP